MQILYILAYFLCKKYTAINDIFDAYFINILPKHTSIKCQKQQKLEEIGVNIRLLHFIDNLIEEEQQGIYHYFLETMEEELAFIIDLIDLKFIKKYLEEKEKIQPMGLN